MMNYLKIIHKIGLFFGIVPAWDFEKNVSANVKFLSIFQSVLISGLTVIFAIFGDVKEFSIAKLFSDFVLYVILRFSYIITFSAIILNRFNKYWEKMIKFAVNNSCYTNSTSSKYVIWYFIIGNIYFVLGYYLEGFVWLNKTSETVKNLYIFHMLLAFVNYLNLVQSSIMLNFLLIINDNFRNLYACVKEDFFRIQQTC